jgi:hypothetical protein
MEARWARNFLYLFLLATGWRLLYLAVTPLDLVPDEAYYWDWGRRPAWGYYSKPPLIGWINTASTWLLGATPFSVRLPAVLFGALGLLGIYGLGARLFGRRVGFWAAVLAVFSPATCILNFIMTIDAPLVCFWVLAMYASWRALENNRFGWWLLTALFCGLGLLSKQMMIVFLLLLPLFLVLSREDRRLLNSPQPYLPFASLCFLAPAIAWNLEHGWITFRHTAHHFAASGAVGDFLRTALDFIGGQLLLINPVAVLLFVFLALSLGKRLMRQDRRVIFLFLFSAPPLLVFLLMSFRQRINANWPAVFYPAVFLLVAAWACGKVDSGRGPDRKRPLLLRPLVTTGVVLTVLTYGLTFFFSGSSLGGGQLDPFCRLKGWHALGKAIGRLKGDLPRPEKTFFLAISRQTASELAFYGPGQPTVYLWNGRPETVLSQYDLWPSPNTKAGWDCLFIAEKGRAPDSRLTNTFSSFAKAGDLVISLGTSGRREFSLYLGQDFHPFSSLQH